MNKILLILAAIILFASCVTVNVYTEPQPKYKAEAEKLQHIESWY